MSPLSSALKRVLQWTARIRIPLAIAPSDRLAVGQIDTLDALGSRRWQEFATAEKLFDCWAPLPGSVWEPFHCATLFAALAAIPGRHVGPAPASWFPDWLQGELPAPRWADRETLLFIDAPGPISVVIAAQLAAMQCCQTVCTFDNWPHTRGLVRPETVLATLLRYAPWIDHVRRNWRPDLPPAWVCDNTRLGIRSGSPKEFDNRYFLDDSLLPGPEVLRKAGIRRLLYIHNTPFTAVTADLTEYLKLLVKQEFVLQRIELSSIEHWRGLPQPLGEIGSGKVKRGSFFRATVGGFGAVIPEPSSSSG